ncbi:MAG: hypothetical protein PHE70_05045 [Tepidanaerobacteraceae bacterium]|nr:hypothetical protein [Tepidanaerobacteraceae bacterium]
MKKDNSLIFKLLYFFGGIYIVSFGKVFLILSGFGVDPWTVFHLGVSYYVNFTVGQITQGVGAIMLLIGWVLKIKPTIGTFLNMYFFGLFLDFNLGLDMIKPPQSLAVSIFYLFIGILINGIGFGIYLNGKLGAGPRDNFMLGVAKVTGKTPGIIKTCMESAAVLIGWLLGGPVGLGTIAYALTTGSIMQWTLDHIKLPQRAKTPGSREITSQNY